VVCHRPPLHLQQYVTQLRSNTNTCTGPASAPQCRNILPCTVMPDCKEPMLHSKASGSMVQRKSIVLHIVFSQALSGSVTMMIILFHWHSFPVPLSLCPDSGASLPKACSTSNCHSLGVARREHGCCIICKQSSIFDLLVAAGWIVSKHISQRVRHCVTGVMLKVRVVCLTSPLRLPQYVTQVRSNTNTCTG